ncbi:hypothetical protein KI387_007839, partial [Taxus chinensis]
LKDLLNILEEVENCLSMVEQSYSKAMQRGRHMEVEGKDPSIVEDVLFTSNDCMCQQDIDEVNVERASLIGCEEFTMKEDVPNLALSFELPNGEPLINFQISIMGGYAFDENILVSPNSRVLSHKDRGVEDILAISLLAKEDEHFDCSV